MPPAPRRSRSASSTSRGAMRWTSRAWGTFSFDRWSRRGSSTISPTSIRSALEDLVGLERMAEKSAGNLVAQIEASKVARAAEAAFRARHPLRGGAGGYAPRAAIPFHGRPRRRRPSTRSTPSTRSGRPSPTRSGNGSPPTRIEGSWSAWRSAEFAWSEEGPAPASAVFQGMQFVLTGALEGMTPRRGEGRHRGSGRARDFLSLEEDLGRRRRGGGGLQAREGAGAGGRVHRRGGAPATPRRGLRAVILGGRCRGPRSRCPPCSGCPCALSWGSSPVEAASSGARGEGGAPSRTSWSA